MNLSLVLTVNSILAAIFGVAFLIAPGPVAALYGVTAEAPFRYLAQLFGAELVAFAVLAWAARTATATGARKPVILALFVSNALGFVVALLGQVGGVVNTLGWSTVAIYFVFALAFGYFQFMAGSTS